MQALPASNTYKPRTFDSWALGFTARYDEAFTGTLRRVFSQSSLRRQCWFHALSCLHFGRSHDYAARLSVLADPQAWTENPTAEVARILTTRRVRDIVHALHGPVGGLVGALGKLGDQPLRPTTYKALLSILSEPQHQARAKVLLQLPKIAPSTVSVLLALPSPWVRGDLLASLKSPDDVSRFTSAVELIRYLVPDTTDEALVQSLGPDITVGQWLERWVLRSKRFPVSPPLPQNSEFVLLGSAHALREAARRYRNCLMQRTGECATGRVAFVEHVPTQLIAELQSLSGGHWLLATLNAPRNGRVDKDAAGIVCRKLQAVGVLVPARLAHAKKFASTARLLSIYDNDGLGGGILDDVDGDDLDLSDLEAELDEIAREFSLSGTR